MSIKFYSCPCAISCLQPFCTLCTLHKIWNLLISRSSEDGDYQNVENRKHNMVRRIKIYQRVESDGYKWGRTSKSKVNDGWAPFLIDETCSHLQLQADQQLQLHSLALGGGGELNKRWTTHLVKAKPVWSLFHGPKELTDDTEIQETIQILKEKQGEVSDELHEKQFMRVP